MIGCLGFITDFSFASSAKVGEWVGKTLGFLKFSRGTRSMASSEIGCCEVEPVRVGVGSGEEVELGFGSVKFTRGLGRKRIVISSGSDRKLMKRQFSGEIDPDSDQSLVPESPEKKTPLKRQRSVTKVPDPDKSLLESLPQELVVRVICGVDHEDLERLFFVSKSIKEAALIAKQTHFAFSTPKKTPAFRNSIDLNEASCDLDDEIEPPNAPNRRNTYRESRETSKKRDLSSISMALFT